MYENLGYRKFYYIYGNDEFPEPLAPQQEARVIERLGTAREKEAKALLIQHNLRLVAYIARKFAGSEIGLEELISIGTIGLINAVNTFDPVRKIKLSTYAARCIENEIRMYIRWDNKSRREISIEEPLHVDAEGNEVLLSDMIGTEEDEVFRKIETEAELIFLKKAVNKLPYREKRIICLRFGLNSKEGKEYTQKEVADLLGISQSYISRVERNTICKLKKEMLYRE